MSWTVTNVETHFRTTNATSYHSPDASTTNLVAGRLYLLFVESRLAGTPNVPSISGTAGSWTQEATLLFFGAASGDTRLTLFSYIPSSNENTVQLTVDFAAQTQTHCARGLYEVQGEDSSAPVVTTATGTLDAGTGTSVSAVISGANNNNAMIAFVVHYAVNEDVTPTSPYLELGQSAGGGTAGDATTVEAQYDTAGTDTATGSWATASRGAIMLAELKLAPVNTDLSGNAGTGSYAVTGADATTVAATSDTPITASAGSYAITGAAATTERLKIVTVKPGGGGTYTSLNSALTTEAANLVTLGYRLVIECYGGSVEDTTAASIAGFTTDATHYVLIRAAAGEGHQGHWDANAYTIHVTDGHCLSVNIVDLVVEGLQLHVEKNASASTHRAVFFSSALAGTLNITFQNCIARASYSGSTPGAAIGFSGPSNASAAGQVRFLNCIAHDFYIDPSVNGSTFGFTQSATPTGLTALWYNCLAVRCYRGFNGVATVKAKNCLALECHNQNSWSGTFHEDSTNNASAGPTGETKGNAPLDIAAPVLYDPLTDDFRLHPGDDSGLRSYGVNLAADVDYAFDFDIVNNARPASGDWAVGPYDPSGDTAAQDVRWMVASAPAQEAITIKARMVQEEASAILYLVVSENSNLSSPTATVGPVDATAANAFIATFFVDGLAAGTPYFYGVKRDTGGTPYTRFRGQFRTAPAGADNLKIAVWGDEDSGATDPAATAEIEAFAPDLIICLGDYHYSDIASATESDYWNAYEAQNELSRNMRLLKLAPLLYTWSDHDFQGSNSDGRYINKGKVQATYRKFFATPSLPATSAIYYSTVYGRFRIIVPDLRSERNAPTVGRIMSATQMAWLKSELDASIAGGQIPVIVSECEWGGAAGANGESWTGFTTDRTELADYLEAHSIQAIILTADAHMVAIDSGANMDFSTDGLMTTPPIVMSCAPLEQNGTPGDGTYDQGSGIYEGDNEHGHGQYGLITVSDSGGETMGVLLEGQQGTTGTLVSYNPTLTPPRSMDASAGSYAVSGVALYTHKEEYEYPIPGQYAVEGADLGMARSLIMVALAGALAITGFDAEIAQHRLIETDATAGSYAITGSDVTTAFERGIANAEAGDYAVAGVDVETFWDHEQPANAGSYVVAGAAAATTHGYWISADAGTYAITGDPINDVAVGRAIAANAGTYAVAGAALTTLIDYVFDASPGSYAVSGADAQVTKGLLESASAGSYALSGQAVTTTRGLVLSATAGSYTLAGAPTTQQHTYEQTASAGAYAISGAAVTTLWAHQHTASAGSYALSGQPATLLWDHQQAANAGAYTISGATAETIFLAQFSLSANPGAYAVTGADAALTRGLLESATAGSYTTAGQSLTTQVDTPHTASAGSYAVTGQAITDARNVPESAGAGSYAISGASAQTETGQLMAANAGSYAVSGAPVTTPIAYSLGAQPGAYALTGAAATTEKLSVFSIDASAGAYALTGAPTTLLWNQQVSAAAGAYAIAGATAATLVGTEESATAGAYALSGAPATTAKTGHVLVAATGAYAVAGAAAVTHKLAVYTLSADAGAYATAGQPAATGRGLVESAALGSYAVSGAVIAVSRTWVLTTGAGAYAINGQPAIFLHHLIAYPTLRWGLPLSDRVVALSDAPTRIHFACELE